MIARAQNIEAILKRCQSDLEEIEEKYNESLNARYIDPNLKININFLGNLRSVLDYLAHEIKEKNNPSIGSAKFYFPIADNLAQFTSNVSNWFSRLDSNFPELFNYLESIQPYKDSDKQWLANLNKVNNDNKHVDLIEQKRIESKRVNVALQGGGSVNWDPSVVTFGKGVYIGGVPVNPSTQLPVSHSSQTVEITTWVDFQFGGINISALGLLKKSLLEINKIFSNLQKLL